MGFSASLGWERQGFCSLSSLPSLSQLAAHVRCIRLSLPGLVCQETHSPCLVCNQGSSAVDGLSVCSERGGSRLALLLSPARRVAMGVPGSPSGVKEGTWCLWSLPGVRLGNSTKLHMPLLRGALLGPCKAAEVEEGPYWDASLLTGSKSE